MKLRGKTLILMGIIILSLILSFFIISQFISTSSAIQSEDSYTELVLKNTLVSLNNDIKSLNNTVNDWSNWDDAYNYVGKNNPGFVSKSINDETFKRLDINLIIFKDKSGRVMYARAFDVKDNKEIQLPENLNELVSNSSLNITMDERWGLSGFAIINSSAMILASKPVLKSSGEGPTQGILIIGRILDNDELQSLSGNGIISVQRFKSVTPNSDFEKAKMQLSNGSNIYITPLNNDSIAGYSVLNGVTGEPTLILKVELPRFIHQNYENAIFYLMLSLIIVGLLTTGLSFII